MRVSPLDSGWKGKEREMDGKEREGNGEETIPPLFLRHFKPWFTMCRFIECTFAECHKFIKVITEDGPTSVAIEF